MLKPLDRCRRDSTLFQFTTRNLRDFIDPDYLLIRVDVQFDLGQAGPCVLAGGGVHLALESGVGLHGAHGHGPVEADALPAQGAVQRRASEAHVVGRDQPVLLQQRLQSSMTRWTPGLPRTSASVIPWTRVASRDIGTPGVHRGVDDHASVPVDAGDLKATASPGRPSRFTPVPAGAESSKRIAERSMGTEAR